MLRLFALLVELALAPARMNALLQRLSEQYRPVPIPELADGDGISLVQAAGGALIHKMAVKGGRIRGYQVLAPTAWNFHRRGLLAQLLMSRNFDSDLRDYAELIIEAIDPGIAFKLEVIA